MLTPFSTSLAGGAPFVFTHAVAEADLDALSGLRQSPMVFQERIPKARELRVACVDGRCFPGALDATRYESIAVDWRHPDVSEVGIGWEPDALPRDVEAQLGALLRALGLVFGAVDLIRTPDGEHVFLEVNPAGEWGMLSGISACRSPTRWRRRCSLRRRTGDGPHHHAQRGQRVHRPRRRRDRQAGRPGLPLRHRRFPGGGAALAFVGDRGGPAPR